MLERRRRFAQSKLALRHAALLADSLLSKTPRIHFSGEADWLRLTCRNRYLSWLLLSDLCDWSYLCPSDRAKL